MPNTVRSVAVAGGTGNLGPAIVQQLLDAGFKVTVLTRSGSSTSSIPSNAVAKEVDYDQSSSLVSALQGHDAVVSNLGSTALSKQNSLIDAAIQAGVLRFLPSEFGSDTTNDKASKFPVYKAKVDTQRYLAEKASEGKISYTILQNAAFLDWGLQVGFLANVKGGSAPLYDGGDVEFSATTLADVGRAVAGVLKHLDETKNRVVRVHSAVVSQNQLLAAARKAKPSLDITTTVKSTEEIEQDSYKVLQSGQGDVGGAMIGFIFRAIFGVGYGGKFSATDNELLGVPTLSKDEVDKLVAGIVTA